MIKNVWTIAAIILLVIACIISLTGFTTHGHDLVYVRSEKMFEEFKMTKELQAKYDQVSNARKAILDSLLLELKFLERQVPQTKTGESVFQLKKENYLRKAEQFEEENASLSAEYDKQIWARINQYVADYGKEKSHDFIYGVNGDGTIMYANETMDITTDVLDFMNKKYEGK